MSELMLANANVIAKVELDTQIATAKAYPRDVNTFISRAIKLATMDQETAESCIFAKPRKNESGGNDFIKGESIRLAEIAMSAWGNMHAATRMKSKTDKIITAEGVAWDLENNNRISKEVERSIWSTRFKKTFTEDMQVVTGNAAASIALRNAIFSVIPRAYIKQIYQAAVKAAIGDQNKISQRIKTLFDKFQKMGIEKEKILAYFKKTSPDQIVAEEVEEMIGIGTAIKEGSLKIDDAFEYEKEPSSNTGLNDEFDDKFKKDKQKEIDQEFLKELGDAE